MYCLEFDESEEIKKMQQYYKSYDELIRDIAFVNNEVILMDRLVYLKYVIKLVKIRIT